MGAAVAFCISFGTINAKSAGDTGTNGQNPAAMRVCCELLPGTNRGRAGDKAGTKEIFIRL